MAAPDATPKVPGLGLDDFLRHSASGAFYLLTIYYLCPSIRDVTVRGESVALVIALAFPLGALIYSFHRAVVHPWIERAITLKQTGGTLRLDQRSHNAGPWNRVGPTDAELFFFWARWDRLKRFPHVHGYMTRAASQMHFLYTVTFAYWLACLTARLLGCSPRWSFWWMLLSVLLLAVAGVDNWRLSRIEINRVQTLYDGTEFDKQNRKKLMAMDEPRAAKDCTAGT